MSKLKNRIIYSLKNRIQEKLESEAVIYERSYGWINNYIFGGHLKLTDNLSAIVLIQTKHGMLFLL